MKILFRITRLSLALCLTMLFSGGMSGVHIVNNLSHPTSSSHVLHYSSCSKVSNSGTNILTRRIFATVPEREQDMRMENQLVGREDQLPSIKTAVSATPLYVLHPSGHLYLLLQKLII
jgi:hypothetical protein